MFVAACLTLHRTDKNFSEEYLPAEITSLCALVIHAKRLLTSLCCFFFYIIIMKQVQQEYKMTVQDILFVLYSVVL